MRWSRRRHIRQRRQLRRAVAFLHETHDRVPFDPVAYLAVLPVDQIARLVRAGQVESRHLSTKLRRLFPELDNRAIAANVVLHLRGELPPP